MVDNMEILKAILKDRILYINNMKSGFTNDHEVGYYEGEKGAYESILDIIEEIEKENKDV